MATDINNDGLMDLFVANDMVASFLFANRGHGKFEEIGLQAGVGYSADGRVRSGMGTDCADYDQDGWMDIFLTDVDEEMFSLYHNNRDETFDDFSVSNGIGMKVRTMSGWGVKFLTTITTAIWTCSSSPAIPITKCPNCTAKSNTRRIPPISQSGNRIQDDFSKRQRPERARLRQAVCGARPGGRRLQ